jgi:hypothetical protein
MRVGDVDVQIDPGAFLARGVIHFPADKPLARADHSSARCLAYGGWSNLVCSLALVSSRLLLACLHGAECCSGCTKPHCRVLAAF